ncbi:hypothetical protein [Pseudomonas cichorii]|uniref:hypothetical protein n=1 Tax=Pseudomonas cichorii TaxID=36746 RepID=UPI001910A9BC|nr:hypothetical protein [Pseudomonas cichorii]
MAKIIPSDRFFPKSVACKECMEDVKALGDGNRNVRSRQLQGNNMKNIQIIDGAKNCVYDIFSATEEEFDKIFPQGTNIAFIDEVYSRKSESELDRVFNSIWSRPVRKLHAQGIHGIVFMSWMKRKFTIRIEWMRML